MIDIFIPTTGRRDITKMLASISSSSRLPHIVHVSTAGNSYAQSINGLYESLFRSRTADDYFFCGADDLLFYPNWDAIAINVGGEVIGTNDLHHPGVLCGNHATHYFVKYGYCLNPGSVADNSYPVMFDYKHNFTDTELVETAKCRGAFKMAFESKVEHLHPAFNLAPIDEGYRKSFDTHDADLVIFRSRSHLWNHPNCNDLGQ